MGEVYRARDTRLGRDIALKILPGSFATNADRLGRFRREAQILASLNHPHIAAIYGLEESDHTPALVLELVEGPTLADRLEAGPLPLDEALAIAQQIVGALEAAHEQGIVHRDLKPANIKLRPDGTVKVLDFGLAKALEPVAADADAALSPTVTSPAMTQLGVILGTAAYMSPEQARGRPVDRRSDVWSFGCVLFEMLSGRQVFRGDDVTESIAAILRAEPDWRNLPPDTPAAIRRLLRRSLAKDPKQRLADVGVARLEINDALAPPSETTESSGRRGRARLPWIAAALSLALLLVAIAWPLRHEPSDSFPLRLEMIPPAGLSPNSIALSPDGRQLAFATSVDGVTSLWVRRLDQEAARPVQGTTDASFPFWAPDGRAIGFFARGQLQRIDLTGGAPVALAEVSSARGGSWSRDGVIVFAPALDGGLMRIPAAGGVPQPATHLTGGQRSQRGHRWPHFLPDGRHFLFNSLGEGDSRGVFVGSLDGDPPVRLLDGASASYASGHLIFVRAGTVNAAPFDLNRLTLTGDSVVMLQRIPEPGSGRSPISFSSTGLFAYVQGVVEHRRLVWVDRSGSIVGSIGELDAASAANPDLSPDGRRIVVTRNPDNAPPNVWVIDVVRGVPTRITFGPGNHNVPLWSADGRRVLFRSQLEGVQNLFVKAVDGLSEPRTLLADDTNKTPSDWSPDGRVVLYMLQGDDLMGVDVETRQTFPVAKTPANEGWGEFSPDGRFVAYQSNESGRFEIYVRTFPGDEGKWLVSAAGGTQARWSREGKELYYIAPDNRLMAVPIRSDSIGGTFDIGATIPLFRTNIVTAGASGVITTASGPKPQYAVAPDGRFLMVVPATEATVPAPIAIVTNWTSILTR
jgi:eukaryotic-like serine/threonine-protein kinase